MANSVRMTENAGQAHSSQWLLLFIVSALLLIGAGSAIAQHNTLTQDEIDDGWQLLFDGHSLEGWKHYGHSGEVSVWSVDDGTVTLEPRNFEFLRMLYDYIMGSERNDLIYHKETFEHFELSLEWKISPDGNSGIFYLVGDEKQYPGGMNGIEMQVLDNDGHLDGSIVSHRAGDLYDLKASAIDTTEAPGKWNHAVVKVLDKQIEHWLNEELLLSIEKNGPEWKEAVANSKFADRPGFGTVTSGYIALQDHYNRVWYRNIKIRRLPSTATR
jgi:hypothetical protein